MHLTDEQQMIRDTARDYLPWLVAAPLAAVGAFHLDGVFIGTTRGTALRNAGVAATVLYIGLDLLLRPAGNMGVWIAMSASYLLRAGGLALYFPGLLRDVSQTGTNEQT